MLAEKAVRLTRQNILKKADRVKKTRATRMRASTGHQERYSFIGNSIALEADFVYQWSLVGYFEKDLTVLSILLHL